MGKQEAINRIADYLTVPIPHRPAKPAKPRKTWRTLDKGRELRNKLPIILRGPEGKALEGDCLLSPGYFFTVISIDEDGAWLGMHNDLSPVYQAKLRLEDPKWQEKFEKIPKRRSKRNS